ncbi:hypothetical protein NV226_02980 [Mycoplasma iguanae]|uniref:Uncharacterized protein n=1 Tax=Mycoplasma iguanae TaxID=292461 RepID=A0ABY5R857_9MOLU|nr:hypothetical protein [Mycoplasma iguanae]UVD81663.1 hypothetical protein NV226_02980 [Mycoplasma iguanae]
MFTPSKKIVYFIERKINRLYKLRKISVISEIIINIFIILINLTSIGLAIYILDVEISKLDWSQKITDKIFFEELGMSGIFAGLIIILFIFTMFFTFYKKFNNYRKYRAIFKKIEYYIVKFKNVKEYTLENLQDDLDKIEQEILVRNKFSWKSLITDLLIAKVN